MWNIFSSTRYHPYSFQAYRKETHLPPAIVEDIPRKGLTYSLGEGTALADGDPVTFLNTESGRDVSGKVLVSLLVTVVLGDVVEVFTADDDGTVHLGGDDTAGQDTATDGNQTGEGALLVCSISVILSHLGFEQHDWTSPEPLRDENKPRSANLSPSALSRSDL